MSRRELEQRLLCLEEENKRLKEENAYLKFKLEEFNAKRYKSDKTPPADSGAKQAAPSAPKKHGGKFGHLGRFRKKPGKIDRVEEVRLECCPDGTVAKLLIWCHSQAEGRRISSMMRSFASLRMTKKGISQQSPDCRSKEITACKNKKTSEHIQEDIILPRVESVVYRHHEYYCKGCKKVVSSLGRDEMANSYIGPKAKALAAFLRYGEKISERDVKNLLEKAFNLNIVHSSIAGFRDQLRLAGSALYEELKKSLRCGPFIHVDTRAFLESAIKDFAFPNPNKRVLKRFANRLARHREELLTFLYEKDIDYHNNHAEL